MASNKQTIRIESINGGISQYERSGGADQYVNAVGINPDAADAANSGSGAGPTVIQPSLLGGYASGTTLNNSAVWLINAPRHDASTTTDLYVYDAGGSVYTLNTAGSSISGLGDLNDGGDASGNGAAYYDNYVYFARETTVARYGPLDGTPAFTDDFWVGTLGKAALSSQAYPSRDTTFTNTRYPNHVLHRHTDGKLYIADVVDNQGTIHYIQTTKTTVEGDTDNGSKFNALDLPYGYYPTDIESFGDDLVISCFEGTRNTDTTSYNSSKSNENRATLFFWDTTSDSPYKKIQKEFPDQIISALENANGVLYTFSSNINTEPTGCRVMRYLGGNSFEQIALLPEADTPLAGGTLSVLNQIRFASTNENSDNGGLHACLWSIGNQNQPLSNALHCVAGARSSTHAAEALALDDGGAPWSSTVWMSQSQSGFSSYKLLSYDAGGGGAAWSTDTMHPTDGNAFWKSQHYKIGSKFQIHKVKLFVMKSENLASAVDLRVNCAIDMGGPDSNGGTDGKLIGTINNDNYGDIGNGNGQGAIILKPTGLVGEYSFQINLFWRGTASMGISLPIEIEYELIPDD